MAMETEAAFNMAKANHGAGRLREADRLYRQVLAADPQHHDCLHRLGVLVHQCGDSAGAAALIRGAIRLNNGIAAYHNHLGAILLAMGQYDEAQQALENAIALAPAVAEAHNNLGNLCLARGRIDEAIGCFERAEALSPETAEIAFNLGNALRADGNIVAAEAAYRRAIARRFDYPDAHVNLALLLLGRGAFAEGGGEYEWRWKLTPPPSSLRQFVAPAWNGEASPGRVLLHAEQGLGDTIQFCRFFAMAAARCQQAILEVPPTLVRLLEPLREIGPVVAAGSTLPPFDAHCPLMSVPWRLGVTPSQLAAGRPYLKAEPELVEKWQGRWLDSGLRIGIAWQGNPRARIDRGRSIPLKQFGPLAALPGVTLISLQKQHGLDQTGDLPALVSYETELDVGPDAFVDTAAVMACLDLVVTSDTAVAHLAGALGRPVWLALEKEPEWRWRLASDSSPWYPTMWLFRQETTGDWTGVFARMMALLAARKVGEKL